MTTGKKAFLRLVQNKNELEYLHDRIIKDLESKEKSGINRLLKRNNNSVKQMLYAYLKSSGSDIAGLMEALDSVLEVHAKECYAIGALDTLQLKKEKGINEKNLIN